MKTLQKPKTPKYKLIKGILSVAFLAGLISLVFEIDIYQNTFISLPLLLSIWVSIGILTTVLLVIFFPRFKIGRMGRSAWILIIPFIYNTVALGGIFVYILMALNFYNAAKGVTLQKLAIIKYGSISGTHSCRQGYAHVIYKGHEKEVVFPCGTETERYKFVQLTIQKRLLGFDIITAKELLLK